MAALTCTCRRHAVSPTCPKHGIGKRNYIANLACLVVIAVVVVVAVFTAPAQSSPRTRPGWISPLAWAIGVCETGKGNAHPDFRHDSGTYEGAFGWFEGTWDLDKRTGYPNHAYQATPRQQNRVLHDSLELGRYFGCLANGGYRSWM